MVAPSTLIAPLSVKVSSNKLIVCSSKAADKVIILSSRPSYVKRIIDINLNSYGLPFKRREAPEFRELFDEIWREIQYDKKEEGSQS